MVVPSSVVVVVLTMVVFVVGSNFVVETVVVFLGAMI